MSQIHHVMAALSPELPTSARQEAGRLLLKFLRDERALVVLGRYPAAVRDETIARCLFKVVQLSGDPGWLAMLSAQAEVTRAYLDQMLRRSAADQVSPRRDGARDPEKRATLQREIEGNAPPDAEQARVARDLEDERRGRVARFRERLHTLAEDTVAQRRPRDQDKARTTWRQIDAMVFDDRSMDAVLREDEGVHDGSDAQEFVRARNRVFANHSRFRRAMFETVDRWEGEGRLRERAAAQTRRAIRFLFRCQTQDPPDVFPTLMEEHIPKEHL